MSRELSVHVYLFLFCSFEAVDVQLIVYCDFIYCSMQTSFSCNYWLQKLRIQSSFRPTSPQKPSFLLEKCRITLSTCGFKSDGCFGYWVGEIHGLRSHRALLWFAVIKETRGMGRKREYGLLQVCFLLFSCSINTRVKYKRN